MFDVICGQWCASKFLVWSFESDAAADVIAEVSRRVCLCDVSVKEPRDTH